jgi:cyclophilin family peptidyl-prolyl cis-trans isomerase
MGRAQKLKQQRREEERRREQERERRRKRILAWSGAAILTLLVGALVGFLVFENIPLYINQLVIETGKGRIVIDLKEKEAPETTRHIESLVHLGSYEGTKWYDVQENGVVTGLAGVNHEKPAVDPEALRKATEEDAQVEKVKDEVNLPNIRGAVGMAKPSDVETNRPLPDSATSEFYILKQDAPNLDSGFTVFGEVIKGMEVVDAIQPGEVIASISVNRESRLLTIEMESGSVLVHLWDQEAPGTVRHIMDLVESGFYQGMNWYRVEDWVVQTGSHARSLEAEGQPPEDPRRAEEERKTVRDEMKLPNVRGAVGILKQMDMQTGEPLQDSATTEFYILKTDLPGLDSYYTVFGMVVEGMEVVDSLEKDDPITAIYTQRVKRKR